MVPLPEHERYSWTLGRLIVALSEEIGIEIIGLKSSTWRSEPKKAGNEADECFYIQNEALMRGNNTRRLKPRLYRQNPPPRVEKDQLKLSYFLQSAEADFVCVDAVSTAVSSN